MPSLIGSLFVSLTADFAPFQRNMRSAQGIVASTSAGMRRNIGLTERSVSSFQRTTSSGIKPYALISAARTFDTVQQRANLLRGALFATTAAFGGLGAALTTNVVSRYLDSFTGLENQMRVISTSSANLAGSMEAVAAVAARSRSSLSAVGTLYSRIAKAAPEEAPQQLLRRVETINKALQLGGATAQEAASAAIQFSQAIASNRLGGEELRAVLETPLGLELAKGIGVTIGEFRKMGYAGELTAEVLFKALDKISNSVDAKFIKSIATIDQALTVADGKITAYAGALDDAYGITKIITGSIGAFADNLQTVVPLLGLVAGGLGTIFAGRLLSGVAVNRFSSIAGGIRAVSDARRLDVRAAREQVFASEALIKAQREAVAASTKAQAGDTTSLAPKGLSNAVKREEASLQKFEDRRREVLVKQIAVRKEIANVTTQTTVAAVRAADAVTEAEQKVNETLRARSTLRAKITRADKALGVIGNPRATNLGTYDVQAAIKYDELMKRRTQFAKELATTETRLADQRAALASRNIRVTELETDAVRKAAEQRVKLVRESIALQNKAEVARVGALGASGRLSAAKGTLTGAGAAAAAQATEAAARGLRAAELNSLRAAEAMKIAQRSASSLALGFGVLRAGAGSLVSFLGGPWGVAFTAAVGIMTYLGVKSRAAAEEIARAQEIINEQVGLIKDKGDASAEDAKTILQGEIRATAEQLGIVTKELERLRGEVATNIDALLNDPRVTGLQDSGQTEQAIRNIAQQFRDGKISIDAATSALRALGLSTTAIDGVSASLKENQSVADRARLAVESLQQQLDRLNGQEANIKINIDVVDPLGVFSKGGPGVFNAGELAKQYKQYGMGRLAGQNQQAINLERNRNLDAAGEGKELNTPEKIRDRADALFDQLRAYGLTRDAAADMAKEELNLAEQTRKAGIASRAAAKDYENFANKLAELKQTGEAAFLSDLDQKVVAFAKSLKNGSSMMREYIAAVNSGDLSQAPKQLLEARDALLKIGAASTWQQIMQQYGTGAQLAGQFAQKQEELNYLVGESLITAQQAGIAYADFLGQFQQYEWIDELSSAFTNFANSAVSDFDNIGDAAKALLKDIANLIFKLTVLQPLENAIKGGIGNFLGGGFGGFPSAPIGGGFESGIGLYHGGGTVGRPKMTRRVSMSAFSGAPRFHSGFNADELPAILQKGEAVLTQRTMDRTANLISNLASGAGGGGGGDMRVLVGIDPANGNVTAYVKKGAAEVVRDYDKTSTLRFPRDAKRARTRGTI